MTYALIINNEIKEYPIYEGDIRLRFPNVSFPTPFVAPEDYYFVEDVPMPSVDYTQNVTEGTPVLDDGVWKKNWVITPATEEQVADRLNSQWNVVRSDRNYRLEKSDWTQLRDAPVDSASWETYRQQLRDITTQTDPFNIVWPLPPNEN